MKKLTSIFGIILFAFASTLTSCGNSEEATTEEVTTEEVTTEEVTTEVADTTADVTE